MSSERNKKIIQKLIQAHATVDTARIGELLSPKLRWHCGGAAEVMGRDEYLAGVEEGARAFSGMEMTVDEMIAEGDRVATVSTIRMRHTGEFQGLPATGRDVTFTGMWMYRILENHIVEAWNLDEDFMTKLKS